MIVLPLSAITPRRSRLCRCRLRFLVSRRLGWRVRFAKGKDLSVRLHAPEGHAPVQGAAVSERDGSRNGELVDPRPADPFCGASHTKAPADGCIIPGGASEPGETHGARPLTVRTP